MRNISIAMVLASALASKPGFAKTHDCPGLDGFKRAGANDAQGTVLLQVDTLFKCHGDAQSFEGAMAGLAGDLNGHSRRAFGIVTFGDDGYFAFVAAPYRVSAPVFFVKDDTSYACVTVQHSKKPCADKQHSDVAIAEVDVEVDVSVAPGGDEDTGDVAPPEHLAQWPSRLLQANFDADNDVATQLEDERDSYPKPQAPPRGNTPAGLSEAKDVDAKDLPMQAGNIGLREPKAPPLENQPAALPEAKDMEAKDLPMQAGNIGLRDPKAPPLENQPAALPEAKDMEAKDLPMQEGNIGLRERKAPPLENQPAALPEAKDVDAKDLPMQAGNIGLREPQAPEPGNQSNDGDDGALREPGKDKDT